MKIAIIGSRDWKNKNKIFNTVLNIGIYHAPIKDITIISGGAVGVDTVAKEAAELYEVTFKEYPPDYKTHGDDAPHVRNDEIIRQADKVIAFWNGERKSGTYSVISKCLQRHKDIEVIFDK